MWLDHEVATNMCMAIVVLTVTCYCHVFVSATAYTSVQWKQKALVYNDGAGHGLCHTENLFVEDICNPPKSHKVHNIVICLLI